ncbi:MAG: hypothetical protein AAF267_15015, partial [Deinococcota bacterium]
IQNLEELFPTSKDLKHVFAYNATVNWMRALAILTSTDEFEDISLKNHFENLQRRKKDVKADMKAFENTLMAFHNLASLQRMRSVKEHAYDLSRSAITTWYYSIYFTSSAMIAGASGGSSDRHRGTARIWHSDFIQSDLLISPFSLSISNLVKKNIEKVIDEYRVDNQFELKETPVTKSQAWGAVISYLSGTGNHEVEKIEDKVKKNKEFKNGGFESFRPKKARILRDKFLKEGYVNFMIQAIRYRGKANYRDAIFLSYSSDYSDRTYQLIEDLAFVSEKYLRMAVHYLSRRVEKGTWESFISQFEKHSRISMSTDILKV